MSAWHTIYTEEVVSIEDAQKIVNKFPDDWFYIGEYKRDEKPIRQDWGWSTIVDVWNPSHTWKDGDLESEMIGEWTIGGSGITVVDFVKSKLKEYGYTVLKVEFSA